MRYVEVTTQLFVFLFAQDHLGAHIGRQFERLPDHPGFPRIRRAPPASSSRHMPGCAEICTAVVAERAKHSEPRLRWFESGTGLSWNTRFLTDHGIPHDSADQG
jgi:hypothetical protein